MIGQCLALWALVLAAVPLGGCATASLHVVGSPDEAYQDENGYEVEPGGLGERSGLNAGLHAQFFPNARFELADNSEKWDDAQRYEVHLNLHSERDVQVETVTGIYVYYENKRWDDGPARVRHESVGIGMEAGALLYPFTYGEGNPVDIAFFPYIRYGIGTASGRFREVPTNTASGPGIASGNTGDFRIEGGLGADIRVLFGDRVSLAAGGGVLWWDSLDTATYSVRAGGGGASVILVDDEDVDFNGRDTFARVLIEIAY